MSAFLSLLGLRSIRDTEDIDAIRRTWPEFDIEWSRGAWRGYPLNGVGEPVSGRTPDELRTAIREAWVATGEGSR